MSKAVAGAAAELRPNFTRGHNKIFLPNHVITFIRPKETLPPNMGTFVVPLQFNKLDFRDYLWHAYNVKVLSVRSFINQQAPERKGERGKGPYYRPLSQKMMIAELEKPFVWPDPPVGRELGKFDNYFFKKMVREREREEKRGEVRKEGEIPVRPWDALTLQRYDLAFQARAAARQRGTWKNDRELDERWKEIERETKI